MEVAEELLAVWESGPSKLEPATTRLRKQLTAGEEIRKLHERKVGHPAGPATAKPTSCTTLEAPFREHA